MKQLLESQTIIRQILRWKFHLIVIGIITVALAILFSSPLFITPLFKSQARVYPINIKAFSEESESEQMLEVVSSTDIKRKMVEVFNLKERYDIKPDDRAAQTHVLRKYDEYVSSSKTRYETIELQVMDSDPEVACAMVDSLIAFYNAKMLEMRIAKYADELLGYQNDQRRKQAEIDSLNKQMEVFRKEYGILDYNSQTLQLTLGYAEVLARGASRSSVDDLQKRLALLGDKGGEFLQMQTKMRDLEKQREEIGTNLEEVQSLINREENFALVVEEPFPADKKSYPTRWIILLASLISVEFLAVLFILLFDPKETSKS
ncbi:GumC domain-containing protein [Mangrovibacterium diazotrophicum]|uniref:Subunit length determinant protein n=1 Tax=Mangrovibacterium diazotrophicum TaxID=1261403 RepID=A0A419W8Z4_9BACT|nr:hypothetical protein [Mangrovibacterium diazotrophicum]RKD91862.1 hypothetical protein BC643_2230 [Mangrovibacterium diazotrophicum]